MSEEPALQIPKRTTPTWEIELLLSGATAFGLIQLLVASNDWFLRLQLAINNHEIMAILNPLQIYARIALICLIVAILVHLVVRAYWIALIGLHSVYRGPPDISKIQSGPYSRRAITFDNKDIEDQIERADNLATQIFGYGVGIALMLLIPSILVLAALGVALLLNFFLDSKLSTNLALFAFVLPVLLFFIVPSMIDQYFGKRIAAESWLGNYLTQHFRRMKTFSLGAGNNTLVVYMISKASSYRSAIIGGIFAGFAMSMLALIDMPRLQSMQDQSDLNREMESSDYASERGSNLTYARRAYIAAPQVRGDYLEVSVPLPNKSPSGGHGPCFKDARNKIFVDCMKRELRLILDDKPVRAEWLLINPRSGQPPTLRAMIDVRDLARGKHQLRIDYPFDPKEPKKAWQELIHFWK